MRRLPVIIDEETDLWLSKQKNQSATVRDALRMYHSDITTDNIEGFRTAFTSVAKMLKDINSKLDYMSKGIKPVSRPLNEDDQHYTNDGSQV